MTNGTFTVKRYSLYDNEQAMYFNAYWGYSIYKKDADRMDYETAYRTACEESKFWGSEFAFTVE